MPLLETVERPRVPRPPEPAPPVHRQDPRSLIALQRTAGNAAVARALAGRTGASAVALDAFPHRDRLQAQLSRAVPGEAVVDPERCAAVGAEAFTEGTRTSFATPEPRLEVAAHEAAHQLQHAGVTRDAGYGPEGHAQKIARAIVKDRSAASLIGDDGRTVKPELRRYSEIDPNEEDHALWDTDGKQLRVADDGTMAVRQDSTYGSKKLWATAARIYQGANALRDNGSVLKLSLGSDQITGRSPQTDARMLLYSVQVANTLNATNGKTMSLWADCGKAARTIMGAGIGTTRPVSGIKAKFSKGGEEKTTQASQPKEMADEIIKRTLGSNLLGNSTKDGWERYNALDPAARDQFDQDHGLNEWAVPEIGGGYTIASGGTPYPGKMTWNFHWAGVIMSSGDDQVTLENYAVGDAGVQNTEWDYQMYGTTKYVGQSFHAQHSGSQLHGDAPTTMAVGPR